MAITYPVNPNSRWSIYDTSLSEVIHRNKKWAVGDGGPIVGLQENLVMLLQVSEDRPTYDSSTQKLVKNEVIDTNANTITTSWTTTSLTQEEIDALVPDHFEITGGIKLAVGESDQNAFARMNSLVDLAGMVDTDTLTIKDVFGVTHSITVADFKANMVAYGNYCYSLFLS